MDKPEMEQDPFVRVVNEIRSQTKAIAASLKTLNEASKTPARTSDYVPYRAGEDRSEMIANLMLAYRHLEDASMRMGKAIQARDGGVSVYDRATTVGA